MKRSLLATDGSKHAQEAAQFLARLPQDGKIELTVLTVIGAPNVSRSYSASDWVLKIVEREKVRAAETYRNIEQVFGGANVARRHVVREGDRGVSIVQLAKEQAAELIVVGARGHSEVSGLLLGTTSDFVATHASCSVLVVRPSDLRSLDQRLRVAIGYEEAGPAQAALEEFSETHWGRQTDVDVVTVVSFVDGFLNETVVDTEPAKCAANKAVQTALDQLKEVAPRAEAHVVESDHVGEGLVLFAEDHHCDLLIVGETPRSFLGRVLLGSSTHFVLRHALCSVWITRNRVIRGTHKSIPSPGLASS